MKRQSRISNLTALLTLFAMIAPYAPARAESARENFAAAVRDFQYSTTVEWDQKDPAFLKTAEARLLAAISRAEGERLSREELLSELVDASPALAREKGSISEILRAHERGMSDGEFAAEIERVAERSTNEGASWHVDGETIAMIGGGLFFTLFFVAFVKCNFIRSYRYVGENGDSHCSTDMFHPFR